MECTINEVVFACVLYLPANPLNAADGIEVSPRHPGGGPAAPAIIAPGQVIQQKKHISQNGFWGDLQTVYQSGWDGDEPDSGKAWHD